MAEPAASASSTTSQLQLDKIAQELLRPITGVITLPYAGRHNAFKASDAEEWLCRKFELSEAEAQRFLKQLKKTFFVESLGVVTLRDGSRDEWLVSCAPPEVPEGDSRRVKKSSSSKLFLLASSTSPRESQKDKDADHKGKDKDVDHKGKDKDKDKSKDKDKDKDKDKKGKSKPSKQATSPIPVIDMPAEGRGTNVNITTALMASAMMAPRHNPAAVAGEDSILAITGGGNISKISKLTGHQAVSADPAEHKKLKRLLGAQVKDPSDVKPVTLSTAQPKTAVKTAVEASALEAHKAVRKGKQPTRVSFDIVPQKLDTNFNSLEYTEILRGGYIVAQYKNTGTLGIADSDKNTIFFLKNQSPVINFCFRFPYLLSLHEDGHLQVYDISTDKTKYYACVDTPDAVESVLAGLNSTLSKVSGKPADHALPKEECRGSVLLVDGVRVIVVRAFAGRYKVHIWRIQQSDASQRRPSFSQAPRPAFAPDLPNSRSSPSLDSSQHAIIASSSTALMAPTFDPLVALPTITIDVESISPDSCVIVPKSGHCRVEGERLLIGSLAVWQLWDIVACQLLHSETSKQDGEGQCSFNCLTWSGDYVAAAASDKAFVWSILEAKKLYTVRSTSVITTLHCDLRGIIYGDRDGDVTLRLHSSAEKIMMSTEEDSSSRDLVDRITSADGFSKKVSFLSKWGEDFLVVAREDGSVCYWHLPSASLVKLFDTSGPSVSMISDETQITMIVKNTSAKPPTHEKDGKDVSSNTQSTPGAPIDVWMFPLQWLDKWTVHRSTPVTPNMQSPRTDDVEERKRGFKNKKNKSHDQLGSSSDSVGASKLHKMLGQDADAPISGVGGSKKLLQVLGTDVLIRNNSQIRRAAAPKLRKSDKKLSAKTLRASRFVPLHIPEALTNKFALLTKTLLLNHNLTVSLYRNSGSILLSGAKDGISNEIAHPSAIVSYMFQSPCLFTLHRNNTLQLLHVDLRTSARYLLHKKLRATQDLPTDDTMTTATATNNDSGSPTGLDEALDHSADASADGATVVSDNNFLGYTQRELGATVISDCACDRVLVVKTYETHHVVWEFAINTDESTLKLNRRVTLSPPEEAAPEPASGPASPSSRRQSTGLLKPLDTHSAAAAGFVLLGNTMEYQVWDLERQTIARSMRAPSGSSYVSLSLTAPLVVAVTRDEIVALSLEESVDRVNAVKYSAIITQSVFTPEWIVCGDVDGYVHVLKHHKRPQDIKPQNLAISRPDFAIGDHPAQLIREASNTIDRRVTSLAMKGQYIVCGHACDCVTVWALEGNEVKLVKDFATRGPVLSVSIEHNNIAALFRGAPTVLYSGIELMITNASMLLGVDLVDKPVPSPGSVTDVSSVLADDVAQLKDSANTMKILIDELQQSLDDKDRRLLVLRGDLEEKTALIDQLVRNDQEKTKRLTAIESRLIAIMSALGPDFMDKIAIEPSPPQPPATSTARALSASATSLHTQTLVPSAAPSPSLSHTSAVSPPGSPTGGSSQRDDAGSDDDTLG